MGLCTTLPAPATTLVPLSSSHFSFSRPPHPLLLLRPRPIPVLLSASLSQPPLPAPPIFCPILSPLLGPTTPPPPLSISASSYPLGFCTQALPVPLDPSCPVWSVWPAGLESGCVVCLLTPSWLTRTHLSAGSCGTLSLPSASAL